MCWCNSHKALPSSGRRGVRAGLGWGRVGSGRAGTAGPWVLRLASEWPSDVPELCPKGAPLRGLAGPRYPLGTPSVPPRYPLWVCEERVSSERDSSPLLAPGARPPEEAPSPLSGGLPAVAPAASAGDGVRLRALRQREDAELLSYCCAAARGRLRMITSSE